MTRTHTHPLDPVESALVDASNAIGLAHVEIDLTLAGLRLLKIDAAIDIALEMVQEFIGRDIQRIEEG